MWWFDDGRRRRRARTALVLFLAAFLAAACGFEPLYRQPADGGPSPADDLAAVRIAPLPDRVGQQLHNLLRDRLSPRGQPVAPAYVLLVALDERILELGIRTDETATRANLLLRARFELRQTTSERSVLTGSARSVNSYNILQSQFATNVSEADARERGLREISDEIRERLAIFFYRSRNDRSS